MTLRCVGLAVLLLAVLMAPSMTFAQEDTSQAKPLERFVLKDGSEIVARVVSETETVVTVRTLSDVVSTIPKTQIASRNPISGYIEGGAYFRKDPNGTRLFFGPTARTLNAGQGYFSVYEIFFPAIGVGITDWLDFSGGLTLFPGASEQIYYLSAKVAPIQIENFDLAGSVLFINVTGGAEDFDGAGTVNVIGTYGSEKAAITLGVGWGFAGSDFSNKPVFILGGELRVSNSIKLITENWFPPSSDIQPVSLGIRFFGERLAADFGLWYPLGEEPGGFPLLPWIGFAYNFGTP